MRSVVWLCLAVAAAATGVVAMLVFADRPPPPAEAPPAEAPAPASPGPPAADETLRPYETTATLTEDLRDALAGPPAALGAEFRRVSERLEPKARSVLVGVAAEEANPKVRALLVLAAGGHVPDDPVLLAFLDDREPLVRRAAALATTRLEDSRLALRRVAQILPEISVEVGRTLPDATRRALEERLAREEDEGVRGTLKAALGR